MTTSRDAELIGASDQNHLAFANAENRLLVTRDADFLRLDAQGSRHAGIVYWTQRRSIGQLISALDMLSVEYAPEDLQGRVLFR